MRSKKFDKSKSSKKQIQSCLHCNSKNTIKFGKRKNKHQLVQIYKCKSCQKRFTIQQIKHITYPINIILKANSTYNLGYTLQQTKNKLNKQKSNQAIPISTIHTWITKYKPILPFHRLRKQSKKLYKPNHIIFKKQLKHHQIYKYQFHKAKLKLIEEQLKNKKYKNQLPINKFIKLKQYLKKIQTKSFPHHIFQSKQPNQIGLPRSSQLKFPYLKITHLSKNNLANKLTSLALNLAKNNKQRHQAIQNFMLINDSTTIATEIPVYLTKDDILYFKERNFQININDKNKTPITGHIDILQIRNNLIHILDYKPEAKNQNPINQLTIYALALASKTKLPLNLFKCAWFDQNNYYEFFPLHAVYPKSKKNN